MIRTQPRPDIAPETVAQAVDEGFSLRGRLTSLPGERDRNFLLEAEDGARWVVKVTSPEEPEEQLAFETRLLTVLGDVGGADADGLPVPALRRTEEGEAVLRWPSGEGEPWRIRVLSHLPGRVFADVRPRRPALLRDLGRRLARLSLGLSRVDAAPPARSDFVWALDNAGHVMRGGASLHPDRRGGLVAGALAGFNAVADKVSTLPRQIVHGDVNDHNVLVDEAGHVSGILDFGDAHAAPAVFDLAIAIAYAVLEEVDPLQAAAHLVAGWHAERPVSDL